jgi:hypothetical protein
MRQCRMAEAGALENRETAGYLAAAQNVIPHAGCTRRRLTSGGSFR